MLALKRSRSQTVSCLSKQKIRSCPTMESQPVIDENLQSRQQAVYGKEAMMRMAQSNVLIVGMNGVGAEVAKDLILANMNAVTLADTANVVISDLSSHFYLSEHDVGQNRAAACLERMKELNPAVRVSAHLTAVTEELLAKHRVVVLCDGSLADAESINEICHKNNIPFVRAESRGVFSVVFSDFGDAFTVADENGEQPATNILASVSNTNPVVAFVIEDELPAVSEGDLVSFREVKGMTELNSASLPPVRVKSVNHKTKEIAFDIDGTSMGAYRGGGTICQVKQPKTFTFKPLREALRNPGELIITDYAKFGRAEQLHVAFIALHRYMAKNQGALPQPSVGRDAAAFVSLAQEVHAEFAGTPIGAGDLDLDLMGKFANVSAGSLSPMAAIVGGLAAQEAIKACALKYTPLTQFLYFDCVEALPSSPLPPSEVAPLGSRYDGQIAVFGRTLQELMGEQHVFLVGAGALGCEFLKNYPMMGVCCGAGGLMTVTDDDVIEKSNLSRQFLFRNWHIGQSKSTSAVEQARVINASLKASPLISRVAPNTEHVFNDTFWETQNVITNALDNVPARLYVDQRCMYFAKPLLESGTLGTKLNTQMVLPHVTVHYGASRDPPEKSAPDCTLHSFPHNINHCLTFARSEFDGNFEKGPGVAKRFIEDESFPAELKKMAAPEAVVLLRQAEAMMITKPIVDYSGCVAWARAYFDERNNAIRSLISSFPESATTKEGNPFWMPPKRFPSAFSFDPKDPLHQSFVASAAILKAVSCGIPIPVGANDFAAVAAQAAAAPGLPFVSSDQPQLDAKGQPIAKDLSGSDSAEVEQILARLSAQRANIVKAMRFEPISFEKDDDTNFHMEFISSLANLRARSYQIEEVDKFKAKITAGNIIPAIATATAIAAGLVCIEFYKLLQSKKGEDFRNSNFNIGASFFQVFEPEFVKPLQHGSLKWTQWDRWVIEDSDITLGGVFDFLKARGLNVNMVSIGSALVYASWNASHAAKLKLKVADIAKTIANALMEGKNFVDLMMSCCDDEDKDVDIPMVSVRMRK